MSTQICRKWAFVVVAIISTGPIASIAMRAYQRAFLWRNLPPNRQQKRIVKRNADLQVRPARPKFSEEYFDLYQRYIEQRHADGDMYPPSRDQFFDLPGA